MAYVITDYTDGSRGSDTGIRANPSIIFSDGHNKDQKTGNYRSENTYH